MTPTREPEGDVAAVDWQGARDAIQACDDGHHRTVRAHLACEEHVARALTAARAQGEASGRYHAVKLVEALADSLERVASRAAGIGQPNTSRVFQEAMSYLRNGAAALRAPDSEATR